MLSVASRTECIDTYGICVHSMTEWYFDNNWIKWTKSIAEAVCRYRTCILTFEAIEYSIYTYIYIWTMKMKIYLKIDKTGSRFLIKFKYLKYSYISIEWFFQSQRSSVRSYAYDIYFTHVLRTFLCVHCVWQKLNSHAVSRTCRIHSMVHKNYVRSVQENA